MGEAQVIAGSYFGTGIEEGLSFQQFPVRGRVTTFSADSDITDSAAAATAMATGRKVNNGVLSVAIPGDGKPLETILEQSMRRGKGGGVVTTTSSTHATPAAFVSHQPSRIDVAAIAHDILYGSRPTLLFGGGGEGMNPVAAKGAGYTVVTDRLSMMNVNLQDLPVSGQFGESHMPYEYDGLGELPHLAEMTQKALELLSTNSMGFFLMVEGGRIDHAAHQNDGERLVREVVEFDHAVQIAVTWAEEHKNTLILVTADHETGDLEVIYPNGEGKVPVLHWGSTGHTGKRVPLYAWGTGAETFKGDQDNTDIYRRLRWFLDQALP